jgi:putative ABC transport system permease protein
VKALSVLLRYISVPELRSRPIRSVLMIGTITTGVALLTAMHVATDSIVSGFASDLQRLGGRADLQVTFGTGETGFPEDWVTKIAAQPYVEQAAALIHSQVTFEDGKPDTVELFGIDLLQRDVLDLYEVQVLEREKEDFTILNDPRGIFVTDVLARERGLHLGSKTRLAAVDGTHEYTVRGIVATKGLAAFLGGRLVAMYLPAAQPVAGRRGDLDTSLVDQIDVRLKDATKLETARSSLDSMLPAGFHADTPLQRRIVGQHTVEGLRATLVGMSSLALLAAVFIIYASTTTMVAERLPAMATLVSVGAGPKELVRAIVVEAVVLGAIGSALGIALGVALSSVVGKDAAAGMGLNYSLPFDSGRAAFDPFVVFLWHPLGGILTAACSAYMPARKLRRVTPLVLQQGDDAAGFGANVTLSLALKVAIFPGGFGLVALAYGVSHGLADWVSAGGISIIIASVLLTLPILRGGWVAAGPVLARYSGISGRIAGENLIRALDRSLVTASAITLSVAIAVGAGSLAQSFRNSVRNWYGFSGDALLSSRAVTGGWIAAPVERDIEQQLQRTSGIADVQTLRVVQGQPYHGERIAVAALSDGLLSEAIEDSRLLGGVSRAEVVERVAHGKGVVVSENFATHFGRPRSGDTLSLDTVSGEVRLPVLAVVPDYVSDKGSIMVGRDVLAERWRDDLVNYYDLRLASGVAVDDLAATVRGFPGGEGLVVTPTSAMVARVDGLIGEAFADIDTIKLLVLFLTAVGIADLVFSNVLSRRRELAVLRMVGLTESQLVRTARLEGLCVTLGAAICGAAVGTVCAWIWVHYNYPVLVGYVLRLSVAWNSIWTSFLLAAVTASVAATVAARYALAQPALSVVRYE